nr:MAG TPA: hypothetical protein [Caudoviricetes sp.]
MQVRGLRLAEPLSSPSPFLGVLMQIHRCMATVERLNHVCKPL